MLWITVGVSRDHKKHAHVPLVARVPSEQSSLSDRINRLKHFLQNISNHVHPSPQSLLSSNLNCYKLGVCTSYS